MFDEQKPPSGLEDATNFSQGCHRVGNRTERVGREHRVKSVILHVQDLRVKS